MDTLRVDPIKYYSTPKMKLSLLYLNPELELLLRCARTNIDSENAEDIDTLLHRDLDWSKIIRLAYPNGVAPLLYKSLTSTFHETVPQDVLIQLKEYYLYNLQTNLLLTNELVTILRIFSEKEIQIIPYKGSVLTESIYGNIGLRQFSDIDIIVHKHDVKKAKEILLSQGYKLTWPKIQLSEKQETSHIREKYNYQFIHEDDEVIVELHWNVTPNYFSFPQDSEWLWQRLDLATLSGKPVFTFTPEDYILILCVHGGNHCWIRLNWICDISELIKKTPSLNWEQLIDESASQGSERMLLLGLLLSHELLGTDLPDEILERLTNQPEVKSLARQVIHKFLSNSWVGSGFFEIPRFHLKARESVSDRWRYCLHLLGPSSKDWEFITLPESLDFLYYLLRPVRLGIEHGYTPIERHLRNLL